MVNDDLVDVEALRLLRPEVWAKYGSDKLPESHEVPFWGGRVAILPYLEGRSTTSSTEGVEGRARG